MIAYLAAPIDAVEVEVAERLAALKREAYSDLIRHGFAVYDPKTPFGAPSQDAEAIVDINNMALSRADVMLVVWPAGVVSVGVPMEIAQAADQATPVAVVGQRGSLQLKGMGVPTFDSIREACGWLFRMHCEKQRIAEEATKLAERFTFRTIPCASSGHRIKWVGEEKWTPKAGYPGDAGYDLFVAKDTIVPLKGFADVDCGISIELPPGVWALITGRSSTIRRRRIHVVNGVIDNGYRGPLFAACQNMGDSSISLEAGERVAQLIPFPLVSEGLLLERVAELTSSERGASAFGSTGN